jgi:hypothetical protein
MEIPGQFSPEIDTLPFQVPNWLTTSLSNQFFFITG